MTENRTEERLCLSVDIDKNRSSLEKYKKLLKEPKYMCRECGRVAANGCNLCYPERL